jgi:hypothetical protein
VVKLHDEAGGAVTENPAFPVQPGWQCPVLLVHRDLLDPALRQDRGAIGVAPQTMVEWAW